MTAGAFQDSSCSNLLSIAELSNIVEEQGRAIESFQIEGVVCAIVPQRNLVVLQDASATALFELPSVSPAVGVGDQLAVVGNHCPLTRTRYGIQVGTAPVVDNDGTHATLAKSGNVFLETGMAPIRLEWFNGMGGLALSLEYEGPQVQEQKVPTSVLWHHPVEVTHQADFKPGVNYLAYEGEKWLALPDYSRLAPVAKGIATNFSVSYRTQNEHCALNFEGFIQIDHAGIYKFNLASDDGSRLYVGNPKVWCQVASLGRKSIPKVHYFESAARTPQTGQWTTVEGEIDFMSLSDIGMELELVSGTELIQIMVVGDAPALPPNLLHQHVRVTGICEASHDLEQKQKVRMVIPSSDQFQVQVITNETSAASTSGASILTGVSQIQRLQPEEARKKLRVRIKGIITQAAPTYLVLQDATGGVFIPFDSHDWMDQPQVGDLWEVEGTTDPGGFSPVVYATRGKYLGDATLPEPIHPTWGQLINGSLDARYIEIHGVVISVSDVGMEILTPDGKIKIYLYEMRRSYDRGHDLQVNNRAGLAPDEVSRSYVGCVVRIRGCVAAIPKDNTRQTRTGEFNLVAAVVSVEESAPANPFALPTRKATDLLLFDPRASTLQRTKVAGHLVYARPHEYLVQDGLTGFRVLTESVLPLNPGALVEAVGFPQLGGSSLVLLAADLRQTGIEPLPAPIRISQQKLPDRKLDATRVEMEAILLSSVANREGRVLELQAGPHHFQARLRLNSPHREWPSLLPDSRLRLTGVYSSAQQEQGEGSDDSFELLVNSVADIIVLQQPSWWTVRHTISVISILAIGLGTAMIWITLLRRKVEERTAQLKQEIEERQLVEHRRVMETERSRVAQDLHDELGSGLTEMGLLGDLVNNPGVPPAEKQGYLVQLTDIARSLVTSLDEIVWAVNPSYDSVASLASYYILFAQRFLDLAGVACRPQIPRDFADYPLAAKGRHGLFLAFKEALNNVVRHSGATEVRLRIDVSDRELIILVADNGHGFDSTTQVAGGEGLQGMRRRLNNLGGRCDIRSHPGTGTEIEFRLPLGDPEL
jgi:signal transduction histidine kinase